MENTTKTTFTAVLLRDGHALRHDADKSSRPIQRLDGVLEGSYAHVQIEGADLDQLRLLESLDLDEAVPIFAVVEGTEYQFLYRFARFAERPRNIEVLALGEPESRESTAPQPLELVV